MSEKSKVVKVPRNIVLDYVCSEILLKQSIVTESNMHRHWISKIISFVIGLST